MAQKRKKQPQETPAPPDDVISDIFNESLTYILHEIQGIKAGTVKPEGHDAASRVAWLAQRAAAVAAERRKAAAAEAKRIDKITKADVLAFLRTLDPADRASLLREAQRIDAEGSVLS